MEGTLLGGKEQVMCFIRINVQCSENCTELMVENVQDAELMIENIVSTALLELFDTVYVNDVKLYRSLRESEDDVEDEW